MASNKPMTATTIISSTSEKPPYLPVFIRMLGHSFCRRTRNPPTGRPINTNFCSTIAILATALTVISKPGAAARKGDHGSLFDVSRAKTASDTRRDVVCNRLTLREKHPVLDQVCAGIGCGYRKPTGELIHWFGMQ